MTVAQTLTLKLSALREKLNALSAKDALTDSEDGEMRSLTDEYPKLEARYRAAVISEGDEEARRLGEDLDATGDGEAAEVRRLKETVKLTDYLLPATAGTGIVGAAVELAAALDVPTVGASGGVAIPWAMLEAREHRAFTTTANNDGPEAQRPILQRLFGGDVMMALGVRMDEVPAGRSEWPLLTGSVAPAQAKEGDAAAAATAASFDFANLKPKRLTGRYEYTHEMAASVPDIEQALRRDLADAVKSSMSNQIINGIAPTTQNPQQVQGFITRLGTAVDLSSAEATVADYGRLHARGVDAIHATRETEVMSVIGDESYQHAAGVYIAGSGESGSELLARRSAGCMASTYIPAKASMKQSAILHAAGPNGGGIMRGDSVAAVWSTLEVIRDIYSNASQGVVLAWVALWDAYTALRSAAYKHIAINIG